MGDANSSEATLGKRILIMLFGLGIVVIGWVMLGTSRSGTGFLDSLSRDSSAFARGARNGELMPSDELPLEEPELTTLTPRGKSAALAPQPGPTDRLTTKDRQDLDKLMGQL